MRNGKATLGQRTCGLISPHFDQGCASNCGSPDRGSDRRGIGAVTLAPSAVPRRSRSLEYGLVLLGCFTPDRPVLCVCDLADALGLSRSTAHRYASTLAQLGYLEQDKQRRYRLANNANWPGATVLEGVRREVRARSILEDLRAQTGHTVSLGLLDGLDVIYVYRLAAHGVSQYEADGPMRAGARFAAPYTPLGMALFSALPPSELLGLLADHEAGNDTDSLNVQALIHEVSDVKESGVAFGPDAHGTACVIAAPVARWPDRRTLAVELTVPAGKRDTVKRLAGLVKHTAKLVSE